MKLSVTDELKVVATRRFGKPVSTLYPQGNRLQTATPEGKVLQELDLLWNEIYDVKDAGMPVITDPINDATQSRLYALILLGIERKVDGSHFVQGLRSLGFNVDDWNVERNYLTGGYSFTKTFHTSIPQQSGVPINGDVKREATAQTFVTDLVHRLS